MKRWTLHPLKHFKRGLASLFVCLVAILPLASAAQWSHVFADDDPRKVLSLPAFHERAVDATSEAPQLFEHPLITVTFDDGWESIYTVAMPKLSKYGIVTTQYIITDTDKQVNYMSDAQIATVEGAGHEIDSHTVSHADVTTLTDASLRLSCSKAAMRCNSAFGLWLMTLPVPTATPMLAP